MLAAYQVRGNTASMFGKASLFASAVCVLVGCYSPAHRLEPSTVRPIAVGVTRADVERRLGPPREIESSNGVSVARYFFHEFHRSEEASRYRRFNRPGELLYRTLSLLYNRDGVIEKKLYDETVSVLHREWNGWIEMSPALQGDAPRVIHGTDTTKSLVQRFGEPTIRTLDTNGRVVFRWFHFRGRADRLGQPVAKLLTVTFENDIARSSSFEDADPRFWPYMRFFQ